MTKRFDVTLVSVGIVLLSSIAAAVAADQLITDRKNECQMSVPADWKLNPMIKGSAKSAQGTESVILASTAPGQSLNAVKGVIEQVYKPIKILEDSPRRLWFEYAAPNNSGGTARAWYVGIPRTGNVCGAQIDMKDGNETLAKTIALSLQAK